MTRLRARRAGRIGSASIDGLPQRDAWELALHSDARFLAEVNEGLGPYQLLNTVADVEESTLSPTVILRVNNHLPDREPTFELEESEFTAYHGAGPESAVVPAHQVVRQMLEVAIHRSGQSRERGPVQGGQGVSVTTARLSRTAAGRTPVPCWRKIGIARASSSSSRRAARHNLPYRK